MREMKIALDTGKLMCRFKINENNELEVDENFDLFFNDNSSDEYLFVGDQKRLFNKINFDIEKYTLDSKIESAQVVDLNNPSIFNNMSGIGYNEIINLLLFYSENNNAINRRELISIEKLKNHKKYAKIMVMGIDELYVPGIVINWCAKHINILEAELEENETED